MPELSDPNEASALKLDTDPNHLELSFTFGLTLCGREMVMKYSFVHHLWEDMVHGKFYPNSYVDTHFGVDATVIEAAMDTGDVWPKTEVELEEEAERRDKELETQFKRYGR